MRPLTGIDALISDVAPDGQLLEALKQARVRLHCGPAAEALAGRPIT